MQNLVGKHRGEEFLVLCTGKTIDSCSSAITRFRIGLKKPTIGMNRVSERCLLDYHLFTNNARIKDCFDNKYMSPYSNYLIGSHIKENNRPDRDYTLIKYTDRNPMEPMKYDSGTIQGYYRTSGCLAIMIAHLMGAKKIYVAGMDGFTHNFDGHVHFHDDDRSNMNNVKSKTEWWERYDKPVKKVLNNLKAFGIDFEIITPTLFKEHYNADTLGIS